MISKSIVASALDPHLLVRNVDAALVELHGRRLVELGADKSGLFSHYAGLVGQGAVLRGDEIQAFKTVREVLPAYREYAVLRAGLGELAFLLNGAGLRVTACEPNSARFEAIRAGFEHLSALQIVNSDDFHMVAGFVPDSTRVRPMLGIATVFVFDWPLETDENFCRGLQRFDGLLINPRLFIRQRDTPSEQGAVDTFLLSLGFCRLREFPTQQMAYFERLAGGVDEASTNEVPAPTKAASQDRADGVGFDALVERTMSLVPNPRAPNPNTTWTERRIRKFDLRSAFGNEE